MTLEKGPLVVKPIPCALSKGCFAEHLVLSHCFETRIQFVSNALSLYFKQQATDSPRLNRSGTEIIIDFGRMIRCS